MPHKKLLITAVLAAMLMTGCNQTGVLESNTPSSNPPSPDEPSTSEPPPFQSVFKEFVTRDGDKLMEGDRQFRFIGFNLQAIYPNYLAGYPGFSFGNKSPDDWELEDLVKSASIMGASVIRYYSIAAGDQPGDLEKNVMGPGVFSEIAFERLDKLLELCNRYGVRIQIGLICHNFNSPRGDDAETTIGSPWTYVKWRGKDNYNDFYTDPELREDFKKTVEYVLNRENTHTGVKYKDDPAIFAWETGNEIDSPDEWVSDIAAYIKSIDKNHLLIDGRFGAVNAARLNGAYSTGWITEVMLSDQNIDIISDHFYPWVTPKADYIAATNAILELTRGKKAFVVGEFGFMYGDGAKEFLDFIVDSDCAGAMWWSMTFRNSKGGYYWSGVGEGGGVPTTSFHIAGADKRFYEDVIIAALRDSAYRISGEATPPWPAPDDVPLLFETGTTTAINWRGVTGAPWYDIERSESADGPWVVVMRDLSDERENYDSLFSDVTAEVGKDYYYRVAAKNVGGTSGWSNVVGPVKGEIYVAPRGEFINPGFEMGTYGWTLSPGESARIDTAAGRDGGMAAVITQDRAGEEFFYQSMESAMNKKYAMKFWFKGEDIMVEILASGSGEVLAAVELPGGAADWTQASVEFHSGKNVDVTLRIRLSEQGAYYFDDFAMQPVD